MDEEGKKGILEEFKKVDGATRLEMWDYACSQQVFWEDIITSMHDIAKDQSINKKLDKMMQEELKKAEQEVKQ